MPPVEENTINGQTETSNPPNWWNDTPTPTSQQARVSVLRFGPGPSRRPSLATANSNISTPPPTYARYGSYRTPATEPIQQRPQFDDPLRANEQEQFPGDNPFGDPDGGLRRRVLAHDAYFTSPIIPPQPAMGTGRVIDEHGFPARMSVIRSQQPEDDSDDDDEKHRLANYHAQADWDPDDEYYDSEPSVVARRPYTKGTLPGHYRSNYSPTHEAESDSRSQTMIVVGSETGRKHFITENICRESFVWIYAR
jgi:hypothetical protein